MKRNRRRHLKKKEKNRHLHKITAKKKNTGRLNEKNSRLVIWFWFKDITAFFLAQQEY